MVLPERRLFLYEFGLHLSHSQSSSWPVAAPVLPRATAKARSDLGRSAVARGPDGQKAHGAHELDSRSQADGVRQVTVTATMRVRAASVVPRTQTISVADADPRRPAPCLGPSRTSRLPAPPRRGRRGGCRSGRGRRTGRRIDDPPGGLGRTAVTQAGPVGPARGWRCSVNHGGRCSGFTASLTGHIGWTTNMSPGAEGDG